MSYITVLTAARRCNKLVSLGADDEIRKDFGHAGEFTATTHKVDTIDQMADVIELVADSPNRCLAQGYFPGTEQGEPFRVLPRKSIERVTGKPYTGGLVDVDGFPTVARIKDAMEPSCWIQLDRDAASGIPKKYADLNDDDWLAVLYKICPGLEQAAIIRVPSTSSRVLLDGVPLDPHGCRFWVRIKDPSDYGAFGQRLKLAAFEAGLGFEKTIKGGSVPWTIFDPTVFSHERLVFDGKPTVGRRGADRLAVVEKIALDLYDGQPLDTHRTLAPAAVDFGNGRKITISGETAVVDGYLTRTTKLVTAAHGRMTVEEYFFSSYGKLRCQAVFRPSKSWNAFVARDDDGMPRVFDNGERQWYTLSESDREVLQLKQRQALAFKKLDKASRALLSDGTTHSVAEFAASELSEKFIYAGGLGWHYWDGNRWKRDTLEKIIPAVMAIVNKVPDVDKHQVWFTLAVERALRTLMAVAPDILDADTYLLNTPEGVLDLRTGSLVPAEPGDWVTRVTEANVADDWRGGRFEQFLQEITNGDSELQEFLQRSLGACLSGAIEEHWLLFWTGSGRNGKNTLGDLVLHLLGDYAGMLPTSVLMASTSNAHPTELMEMRGKRLVISSELSEGVHWNEARLNSVTGDAVLKGRYMRQDFVEFARTHKHLIYANSQPVLRNVTPALKARLKIVPFKVSFIGREDPLLGEKLWEERDCVLAWLVEGHMAWLANGRRIGTCAAVELETSEYLGSQDVLQSWIDDCCEVAPGEAEPAARLYTNFKAWCMQHNEDPMTMTRWGMKMKRRFLAERRRTGQFYVGLGLPGALPAQVADFVRKPPGGDE